MLAPVEKWIIHHTYFMLTLIVYLYALYFTYRKANIPSLFLRHKFGQVFFLIAALLIITWGLSQIPIPKDKFSTSSLDLGIRQHMRTQTVWFFFLIVTGFSLAIELTFELFRQILSKQEIFTRHKSILIFYSIHSMHYMVWYWPNPIKQNRHSFNSPTFSNICMHKLHQKPFPFVTR